MQENNKRIVFLCSGGGGNLRFVNTALKKGYFGNAILAAVLTDRECGANDYARKNGIYEKTIDFTLSSQLELIESIDCHKPHIIITTVHKILNEVVVEKFRGKLINVHYSILPAFSGYIGSRPIMEALNYGAKLIGVTIHMVDESLDGGRPLMQVTIPVKSSDQLESLMDLHFRCGCLSLGAVIRSILFADKWANDGSEEAIKIKERICLFSNKVNLPFDFHSEKFWDSIRL